MFTAIAIVPLEVMRMNVMIAMRRSGTGTPNASSANTSLGFGHGSAVVIRTVMYEVRKHVKMNVSDRRKIHIIALPQGTPLKTATSSAQSFTSCRLRSPVASAIRLQAPLQCRPPGFPGGAIDLRYPVCAAGRLPIRSVRRPFPPPCGVPSAE